MPLPAEETFERVDPGFIIREVPLESVLPLRHTVLRIGRPFESARSRHDPLPGTKHLGAFVGDALVGVVSQFPDDTPLLPGAHAERFRGMAVDPAHQGRGIGRALMRTAADLARGRGAEGLWANGRDTALDFYRGIGFHVGAGFVDDEMHLGHHVVFARLDELHP